VKARVVRCDDESLRGRLAEVREEKARWRPAHEIDQEISELVWLLGGAS
jgi:hypothetical protein